MLDDMGRVREEGRIVKSASRRAQAKEGKRIFGESAARGADYRDVGEKERRGKG